VREYYAKFVTVSDKKSGVLRFNTPTAATRKDMGIAWEYVQEVELIESVGVTISFSEYESMDELLLLSLSIRKQEISKKK